MTTASLPRFHATAALVLFFGMAATVGGALLFEHWGGYIPCALCLEQRVPYYLGLPVTAVAFGSALVGVRTASVRLLFFIAAVLMGWSAYLGAFHAGVEWGWWPGPTDCGAVAAPADTGGQGVLDALDQVIPPSCDQAALRIFGLSLAGWNFLIALGLGLIALWAAFRRPKAA